MKRSGRMWRFCRRRLAQAGLCPGILMLAVSQAMANPPGNMTYVEVNHNALTNAGCYVLSGTGQPFFNKASVFAGNINGETPDEARVYLNPQTTRTLNDRQGIKALQAKGIKVLLTILGNHQNAGWSCFTREDAARRFAAQLARLVADYQLDGIDIDDEYSLCAPNNHSMIMVARHLKTHPDFQDKLLTKALYKDKAAFSATYDGHRLSDFIDYGWEMSYEYSNLPAPLASGASYLAGIAGYKSRYRDRLLFYRRHGMDAKSLSPGVSTAGPGRSVRQRAEESSRRGYNGVMVFNVTAGSQNYLSEIAAGQYGNGHAVTTIPGCLRW